MLTDQELQSLRNQGNEAEAAADEIAALRAEVAEWQKLRNPAVLHANLLRGLPARLDAATYLHLGGHDQLLAAERERCAKKPLTAQQLDKLIEAHVGGAELADSEYSAMVMFAAAVERAHGIGA